jgi:hypothetical protein
MRDIRRESKDVASADQMQVARKKHRDRRIVYRFPIRETAGRAKMFFAAVRMYQA